ncbi:MAG TPA: DUF255 domain-containing protein [Phycisphaerae bacterium]|nr:DUF255 domain-containing protein [Phycisphaerae bacterium]
MWHNWSAQTFAEARKEHKLVLLDLEAVWCHWCHVMDQVTYSDPNVIHLINQGYIAVRVDQDSRPDLANKYEDFGWPATIILNADNHPISEQSGYIPPNLMARLLLSLIKNPAPDATVESAGPAVFPVEGGLSNDLNKKLLTTFDEWYDPKLGGWGMLHKFLNWYAVEYCLSMGAQGNQTDELMAVKTLDGSLKLIDPVWGGAYQYSVDGDWNHPHFEKIMQIQAEDMYIYVLAYLQTHDQRYLDAAKSIDGFMVRFMTGSNGAFYTSMDADVVDGVYADAYFSKSDVQRRKLGTPRIDQNQYARENGWIITSLTWLYGATGNPVYLDQALNAQKWICNNRAIAGGGFSHGHSSNGEIYLDDTLAMGQAFLGLYAATGDRQELQKAQDAAEFIRVHFTNSTAGFITAVGSDGTISGPEYDENIEVARWANLLWHYTADNKFQAMASHAMRYIAAPTLTKSEIFSIGGVLMANQELSMAPVHIMVVGSKNDPEVKKLFLAAQTCPLGYRQIEWYDPAQGALPDSDVEYPKLNHAAAFFCSGQRCSPPVYSPSDLTAEFVKMDSYTEIGGTNSKIDYWNTLIH